MSSHLETIAVPLGFGLDSPPSPNQWSPSLCAFCLAFSTPCWSRCVSCTAIKVPIPGKGITEVFIHFTRQVELAQFGKVQGRGFYNPVQEIEQSSASYKSWLQEGSQGA